MCGQFLHEMCDSLLICLFVQAVDLQNVAAFAASGSEAQDPLCGLFHC